MASESSEVHPNCAACRLPVTKQACKNADGIGIEGCPTLEAEYVLQKANKAYEDPEILAFAKAASLQEAACYANRGQSPYVIQPSKTRIEEIIQFSRRMGYTKLGLSFCIAMRSEAAVVHRLLTMREFELISVVCKSGRTPKSILALNDKEKTDPGCTDALCNPIYQAELLNEAGTQFNILLGLCVGHDALFVKHSNAPCTVLAAKDKTTGHNPLSPIYALREELR